MLYACSYFLTLKLEKVKPHSSKRQSESTVTMELSNTKYGGIFLGFCMLFAAFAARLAKAEVHHHEFVMRTPWADGPAYVTQCPIKPGQTYTYRFTIEEQEGTLWCMLTANGYEQLEWWNRDSMSLLQQALATGVAPNVSDAYTINGQPGDLYRCSSRDTITFPVEEGETVLLRIINAALNQQLFFAIANHQMTVVSADATYHKPFTTNLS
ncbi:Laccase-3 [Bienertia sinuspersici]